MWREELSHQFLRQKLSAECTSLWKNLIQNRLLLDQVELLILEKDCFDLKLNRFISFGSNKVQIVKTAIVTL